ncbi:hypothetical protein KL864_29965 [Mycolicibacterium goodii]|uniref:DUF7159 family protein n=2 Tax=Mycolicibacterium goodii TaxID=134601 RepID=UPI001BDBF7FD|nr:hypothetical protein [Mycolicibacterium goodii]MBU8820112.1 hypothetical protein [Mycolicibacterium goodii]
MDIVLGVSMTPTTVRMVLVEGENADGVTVDHDVFDVTATDDVATMSAADQVVAAILGTQESAESGGHHLKSIGVTWSDHSDASALRDSLTAHGIDDVMMVSEGHAAAALAQAVGRAVGYDTTALLFIDRDAATLSVVQTEDGSVVKVLGSSLHSTDAMAVLTDMAAAVAAQETPPDGMFIVGSGVDVSSVKEHLQHLVSMPVNAPEEPELALARGAALASAHAPAFEASTVGLAYSQDPDGPTAGSAYALAGLDTQLAPARSDLGSLVGGGVASEVDDLDPALFNEAAADEERKPFLLVGSALTSVFVIGVVALVISLAVSIRPTVDQRPAPAQGAVVPSAPAAKAPAPAPAPEAKPVQEAPPPAPPPETIKAPVPVVQEAPQPQAPPRTVYVEQPQAPAPAPAAPPPAPEAPPPAPAPVAPAPVLPAPAPIYQPPGYVPPVVVLPRVPSIFRPPWEPQRPPQQNPWNPPWDPPKQAPQPQWPGSGGWNPGDDSDDGPGRGGRGGGDGDWNPGRGSSGGSDRGGSGNGGWNPGGSGGSGGHNGGGSGGNGGGIWPFPFGSGRH